VIDRRSDRAFYKQLADELREQIASGHLAGGARLPSQKTLAEKYGISIDTVRDAIDVLKAEGLVVTRQGQPTRVREAGPKQAVPLPEDFVAVGARMPTQEERDRLDLATGVPVLVVRTSEGEMVYAADSTHLVATDASSVA